MNAALISRAAATLRRGVLLTGLLAIMAGILGMHIMTGMHGAHALPPLTASAQMPGTTSLQTTGPTEQMLSHPAVHQEPATRSSIAACWTLA